MANATFSAVARERAGKGAARAVRRQGLVPCVVYGENKSPISISIDPRIIQKGLEEGHFFNTVYTIDVEGKGKEQAIPRDVQLHPVSDAALHVDFLRVGKRTVISVAVPVLFLNEEECPALNTGGQMSVVRHEVEINCRADQIPSELSVDLTGLEVGDTIRMSSITLPDGASPVITDRDFVIANLQAATIAQDTVEEAEGEEGEGAEEGEAADEDASE